MDLIELQKTKPKLSQFMFAKLVSFDFNKSLIALACRHFNDRLYEQQLNMIVDYRALLTDEKEGILEFFKRVEVSRRTQTNYDGESLRLCVKSGVHLQNAKHFVTCKDEFVSSNEYDYCIRRGNWFIECTNPNFSPIINENLNQLMIVLSSKFNTKIFKKLKDVEKFDENSIVLKSGEVFKVITLQEV